MGLDMYLKANVYVSSYNWNSPEEKEVCAKILDAMNLKDFLSEDSPSISVVFTCGYWRKANQIHKWFVDYIQGGTDDCETYSVDREMLTQLRDQCKKVLGSTKLVSGKVYPVSLVDGEHQLIAVEGQVLEDPTIAEELLPSQGGPFFGGTAYDEWYCRDLERTVEIIDKCFKAPEYVYFSYRASW